MTVKVIILVLGVAIILFIYSQWDPKGNVDDEVCRQSVLLRGTVPTLAKGLIPLKCQTEKICIRGSKIFGKGECNEMENEKKVTNTNVETLAQVEKAISDEFVNCWSMMGKGHLSIYSGDIAESLWSSLGGRSYSTCVVCSRIAFDEETLAEKGIVLDDIDIFEYMQTHKIPNNEESYYDFLSEGTPAKLDVESLKLKDTNNKDVTVSTSDIEIIPQDIGELAIVFTQISTPTKGEIMKNVGIGAVVGGVAISKVPFAGKAVVKTGGKLLGSVWTYVVAAIGYVALDLKVKYNQGIVVGYCGDFTSGSEAKEGCSVVKIVKYNSESLGPETCDIIESVA